jgi:hypothetical protein
MDSAPWSDLVSWLVCLFTWRKCGSLAAIGVFSTFSVVHYIYASDINWHSLSSFIIFVDSEGIMFQIRHPFVKQLPSDS